jgi:hypothetical protein
MVSTPAHEPFRSEEPPRAQRNPYVGDNSVVLENATLIGFVSQNHHYRSLPAHLSEAE